MSSWRHQEITDLLFLLSINNLNYKTNRQGGGEMYVFLYNLNLDVNCMEL